MKETISFINELKNAVKGHKYVNAEDGTKIDEYNTSMSEEFEKQYQHELTVNMTCNWVLNIIDNLEKIWISRRNIMEIKASDYNSK